MPERFAGNRDSRPPWSARGATCGIPDRTAPSTWIVARHDGETRESMQPSPRTPGTSGRAAAVRVIARRVHRTRNAVTPWPKKAGTALGTQRRRRGRRHRRWAQPTPLRPVIVKTHRFRNRLSADSRASVPGVPAPRAANTRRIGLPEASFLSHCSFATRVPRMGDELRTSEFVKLKAQDGHRRGCTRERFNRERMLT